MESRLLSHLPRVRAAGSAAGAFLALPRAGWPPGGHGRAGHLTLRGPGTRAPCPTPLRPAALRTGSALTPVSSCRPLPRSLSQRGTVGPVPQSPHPPCLDQQMEAEARGLMAQQPHKDRGLSQGKIYGLSNVSTPGPGDGHGETTVTPHDLLFPEPGGLGSESCWCHGAPGSGLDGRDMRPSPAPSPRAHGARMRMSPSPEVPHKGEWSGVAPPPPCTRPAGGQQGTQRRGWRGPSMLAGPRHSSLVPYWAFFLGFRGFEEKPPAPTELPTCGRIPSQSAAQPAPATRFQQVARGRPRDWAGLPRTPRLRSPGLKSRRHACRFAGTRPN